MANHRVPDHFIELFQAVGDRENGLTQSLSGIPAFGGSLTMKMISFISELLKKGNAGTLACAGVDSVRPYSASVSSPVSSGSPPA
jgi:hypothetical protein